MTQKEHLLVHIDALYRSALYLAKSDNNADDLVQETYLKAFKFLQDDKEIRNVKAWLFRILMNTFINKYRKNKREPSLVDFDSVEAFHESLQEEVMAPSILDDESVLDSLMDDNIKRALEALPDDFRMVILLSIVEGFFLQGDFKNSKLSRWHGDVQNIQGAKDVKGKTGWLCKKIWI